jgi:hypothetical protein
VTVSFSVTLLHVVSVVLVYMCGWIDMVKPMGHYTLLCCEMYLERNPHSKFVSNLNIIGDGLHKHRFREVILMSKVLKALKTLGLSTQSTLKGWKLLSFTHNLNVTTCSPLGPLV